MPPDSTCPAVSLVVPCHKFDRYGDWHYFRLVPRLTLALLIPGRRSDTLVQQYWYEDR